MNTTEIYDAKQVELNLLRLAYYKCTSCGFIRSEDTYIAIAHIVCCNLCGCEVSA